jgi:streptogramin lyase
VIRIRTSACAAVVAALAAGCGGHGVEAGPREPARSDKPSVAAPPTLPDYQHLEGLPGVLAVAATPEPDWITLVHGIAWVANVGHGVGRFGRDGRPLGVVRTKSDVCLAMDQGLGSVWAADCDAGQLVRMDARTGALQKRIELGFTPPAESSLAVGPEGVFLLDGANAIARVDPGLDQTAAERLPAPDRPSALRYGFGSLWVTSEATGIVSRLDPATGAVQAEIAVLPGIIFLATGEGAVWVMNNENGTVNRIDPVTNKLVATIPVDWKVHGGDIAVGHGAVWARVTDALVSRIDPRTNTLVARYGSGSGSGSVAADGKALWISAHEVRTVWRILLDQPGMQP